jgi:hypothetical protein
MADLTDPDLHVAEGSVEGAWQLASTLTHDDAIGIHVTTSLPRGALDLVEYAFRSSPSLAMGLQRLLATVASSATALPHAPIRTMTGYCCSSRKAGLRRCIPAELSLRQPQR